MGTGISQVALIAGYEVTQYDISMDIVTRSRNTLEKNLGKLVSKGRLTEEDIFHLHRRTLFCCEESRTPCRHAFFQPRATDETA